jgi:hypothetical protein
MLSVFGGPGFGLLGGASQEFRLPGVLPFSASRLWASLISPNAFSCERPIAEGQYPLVLGVRWPPLLTLVISRLRERFPDAIQQTFGRVRGALTATESTHLHGFRKPDEFRNRAAKAAKESDLRLRAKGFQLEAQPAPLS